MSAITFTVEIDPKEKKTGTHEIRIRMTQNRKHKRFNLGYAIEKKFWNESEKKVRSNHPLSQILNAAIKSRISDLEKEYLISIVKNENITQEQIISKVKREVQGADFIEYFRNYIKKFTNGNTIENLTTVCNKLSRFRSSLAFGELNYDFLQKFEQHLRNDLKNNSRTVAINIRIMSSVYNFAISKQHYVPNAVSPFFKYKLKTSKVKREKLKEIDIEKIENLNIEEGTIKFHARNVFLLCYYLLGVRASSMIKMRWHHIQGNRCVYDAVKGQKAMDIIIPTRIEPILNYYKQFQKEPDDYILPYLDKSLVENEGKAFKTRIKGIVNIINKQLRKIQKDIESEVKITTHIARHSLAYNSRRKTGDIYAVQKALGHSSILITEMYFGTDDAIEADELSKTMFGD